MDYQEIIYSKQIQTCFVLGNETLCTYNCGRTRYEHKKLSLIFCYRLTFIYCQHCTVISLKFMRHYEAVKK